MYRFTSACLLLSVLCGCGGGGPAARTLPTEPVTGSVTYQGKPVVGATVLFAPVQAGEDSFTATALTDDEGKYSLVTAFGSMTESAGAVAGDYNVTIIKTKAASAPPSTSESSPDPAAMSQQLGAANSNRTTQSSGRMGPMGRPGSGGGAGSTGLAQEDSEIPVKYSAILTTPLKGTKVPGGTYDFALED